MQSRHRKRMSRRTRVIVLATCALGILGAGAAGVASAQTSYFRPQAVRHSTPSLGPAMTYADRGSHGHRPRPSRPAPASPAPSSPAPASVSPPSAAPSSAAPSAVAPSAVAPSSAPPSPVAPASSASASSAPTTVPTTAPTTATVAPPASGDAVIDQALAHINAARVAAGLKTYTLDANLTKAAAAHNALMVAGCGLSHQCPGEAGLGDRFTAAGVSWRGAGENIGQGNAANNEASIVTAANGLTDLMLAEVPPNDGHRRNLLNTGFSRIGLAVTRGTDGRVWYTQDFAN